MAVDLQAPRVRLVKEWQFDFAHGLTTVADNTGATSSAISVQPLNMLLSKWTIGDVAKGSVNKFRAFCVQATDLVCFSLTKDGSDNLINVFNTSGDSVDLTGGTVKVIVQEYRSNRSR